MSKLTRFGVSMEQELLEKFDQLVTDKGYANRSEAIRDLVKSALVNTGGLDPHKEVAGTITLIYPYKLKLRHVQTNHHPSLLILANLQVHLDRHTCLKVLVVKGKSKHVQELADGLLGMKGVLGQFTVSATEDLYKEAADGE